MKNLHGDGYVQKVEERGSTGGWPMGENPVLMIIAFIAPILYIINTLKWGNDTVSHICMIAFIGSIILDGIIGFFTLGR